MKILHVALKYKNYYIDISGLWEKKEFFKKIAQDNLLKCDENCIFFSYVDFPILNIKKFNEIMSSEYKSLPRDIRSKLDDICYSIKKTISCYSTFF